MSRRHGVRVHTQHLRAGEHLPQLLLYPLGAEADVLQRAAAFRAPLRCPLGITAVVAHEPVVGTVVRQIHTAPRALRHIAALWAQQLAAAAPPIQKQDALLTGGDILRQLLLERAADDGAVPLTQLLPQISHHHLRQCLLVVPLRQLQQVIVPLPCAVIRLHRGCGGAEKQPCALQRTAVFRHIAGVVARGVFRLVRPLLLLVHDDKPQLFQRREHRRAGAQHDMCLAAAQPLELVVPLRHPQSAVEQRHLMPEIGGEPRHHLGRQRDLRNEDHHGLPPLQQLLRQTDVHHSLAAAGNAPQQRNARLAGAYLRQKGFAHPALLVIQCQRFRLYSVLFLGDTVLLLLPERHRAAFFQRGKIA